MLKKIFGSKLFKLSLSALLIYFAFKKVDINKLFIDIKNIPIWFLIINVIVSFFLVFLISFRWSLILFHKVKIKTVLVFTRASFLAAFYSLFFPTAVAGDVLKWVVIDNKYPEIPKTRVLGSVILDRFIGFSMFVFLGLISAIIGKQIGLIVPTYVYYLLIIFNLISFSVYFIIYFFDVSKLLPRVTFLHKLDEAFDLLKDKNKGQIIKCLFVSLTSELIWISQMWFLAWKFGTNLGVLLIFVFMPIISMILILPISIGGFGAREQLYLLFFSQFSKSNESLLLMSTFAGILGIFNALFGGFLSFFDHETRKKMIDRRS